MDEKPNVFELPCRIVSYVDADTVEVRWLALPAGSNWRVRLKDAWIVEDEDDPEEHTRILEEQKRLIGEVGDLVKITNTRHHRTFEWIEARLTPFRRYW